MNQMRYNEYNMLREETMEGLSTKESIRRFVITTAIAVLTLSGTEIWQEDALIYLILMVTIVLSLARVIEIEKRTQEIITYRIVFLEEDDDIRWARAIAEYENQDFGFLNSILRRISKFDFFVLALLNGFIFFNKFFQKVTGEKLFNMEICVAIILEVLLVIVFWLTLARYNITSRKKFNENLYRWTEIKHDCFNKHSERAS